MSGKECIMRHANYNQLFSVYCNSTTLRAEKKVQEGPKKGLGHAMNLSIKNNYSEGLSRRPMLRPSLNCLVQQPVLHQSLQLEVIMNSPQWLSRKCCVCNKICKCLDVLVFSDKNKKTLYGTILALICFLWD